MIVVLQADDESGLKGLQTAAQSLGISCRPVVDYGLTEVANGTLTAVAIGPDEVARVDSVCGRLDLFRDTKEASDLRVQNTELQRQLTQFMQGAKEGAIPSAPPVAAAGDVWLMRDLVAHPADSCGANRAVVPEMFEQWTW